MPTPGLRCVRRFTLPCAALAAALALAPRSARAQDAATLAARRSLIEQAQQARTTGDHPHALDLAQRAAQLQMSPSLRLFIAQEQESLGRLAEAFGEADQCMRDADADRAMRNRETVLGACRALTQALRGRIAHVTVEAPAPAPGGLAVTVGGAPLAAALIGVPYTVTPGEIEIAAAAPGFSPFRRIVHVAAGRTEAVRIELAPVSSEAGEHAAPSSTVERQDTAVHPVVDGPVAPARRGPGAAPWVVVGVGGAALVTGALFFGLRSAELGQCTVVGGMGSCPNQGVIDRIGLYNGLGIGLLAGGAAVAAGGLLWYFLAPRQAPAPGSGSASLQLIPTGDSVWLGVHGRM